MELGVFRPADQNTDGAQCSTKPLRGGMARFRRHAQLEAYDEGDPESGGQRRAPTKNNGSPQEPLSQVDRRSGQARRLANKPTIPRPASIMR